MVTFVIALGVCSKKAKGNFFVLNPDDCSRFDEYECDGNGAEIKRKKHVCFDDTLFDTETESCQPPDTVICENVIRT